DDDLVPYNLERAKSVLALTWLLTDKTADLHPLGNPFGPWLAAHQEHPEVPADDEFALILAAKGRALARVATLDQMNCQCRARWMELARAAWKAVRASTGQTEFSPGDPSEQSLEAHSGIVGRRMYVKARYQQLAQERDPAGN